MKRTAALLMLLLACLQTARAQLEKVSVSLTSDHETIAAGKPFYVGLKMAHLGEWHSYWTNPGTGIPTTMEWELPEGFKVSTMISPIPEVKESEFGNIHYYEKTIYHLFKVTPPTSLSGQVTLKGAVAWLQCLDDQCDPPQSKDLTLTLDTGDEPVENAVLKTAFQAILDVQATSLPAWTVGMDQTEEVVTLKLTPGEGANADPGKVYVFEEEQLLDAVTATIATEGKVIVLTIPKMDSEPIAALKGFVYAPNGWLADGSIKALALSEGGSAEGVGAGVVTLSGEKEESLNLIGALFFAFLGGMILNLMPCVFPVLSIKILSFVEQGGEDLGAVKKHGLVFALGVLISIWILAAVIIATSSGWGAHLANPYVAAIVVTIMFVMGLNLAGLFEMGTGMVGVGGDLMQKKGLSGSFFSGVLTTVVATPCSGPFLGAVMAYTLSQPVPIAFLLFTLFGLGVAAPYVILSFFPPLVNKLPRPGAWMETFKQVMAFPMFAASIFFLNSFAGITGISGAIWLLVGLLVLACGLWVYGKWCLPMNPRQTKMRGLTAAILLGLGGVYLCYKSTTYEPEEGGGIKEMSELVSRIRDLRQEGRMVYLDFTADW